MSVERGNTPQANGEAHEHEWVWNYEWWGAHACGCGAVRESPPVDPAADAQTTPLNIDLFVQAMHNVHRDESELSEADCLAMDRMWVEPWSVEYDRLARKERANG